MSRTPTSTAVAYGCRLSSVVDYNNFIAVTSVGRVDGEMSIMSACGTGITRGEASPVTSPKKEGTGTKSMLMKNCAILRVNVGDGIASVKVFKQYLHICKVGLQDAVRVADFVCKCMKETQELIRDEDRLRHQVVHISTVDTHIPPDTIDSVLLYYRTADICLTDLSHEEIEATMTNHILPLGSCIHTPRLARLLRDEKGHRRWIITFDNALSMSIRVLIPFSDSDKKGYNFAIQPSGYISYSKSKPAEAITARDELHSFINERMALISL